MMLAPTWMTATIHVGRKLVSECVEMSDNKNRGFRGVWIPAEVWLDERLTAIEKMILMEIDSLDGDNGCYASNEYLAEFCQCSKSKVSAAISKLKKLGYVRVKSFDGRKRTLESTLTVTSKQTSKINKADSQNVEQIVLIGEKSVLESGICPKIEDEEKKAETYPNSVEDIEAWARAYGDAVDLYGIVNPSIAESFIKKNLHENDSEMPWTIDGVPIYDWTKMWHGYCQNAIDNANAKYEKMKAKADSAPRCSKKKKSNRDESDDLWDRTHGW